MSKPVNQNNPLLRFMRQPKIYISLPSQGQYWPAGSIDIPDNGQLPVYSMTAKDEIMFKTPDALMNGQAIVDVIQSCIPNIKNAWLTPSIDLDMLLISIRLATYGDKMSIMYRPPGADEDLEYQLDLHEFIDKMSNNVWIEQVPVSEDMIVFVKPLTYRNMSQITAKSFETTKMMQLADNPELAEADKIRLVTDSFKTLTELTTDMVLGSILKIKTSEGDVTETRFIREFIENVDKSLIDTIQNHINSLKEQNEIKPVKVATTPEQQEAGAPEFIEIPVSFDNANFFG